MAAAPRYLRGRTSFWGNYLEICLASAGMVALRIEYVVV